MKRHPKTTDPEEQIREQLKMLYCLYDKKNVKIILETEAKNIQDAIHKKSSRFLSWQKNRVDIPREKRTRSLFNKDYGIDILLRRLSCINKHLEKI